MGRPLNKRYFGAPTTGGNEIKVQFHNGTASVDGWIVKQTGSKRFICSDGSNEAECYLVDKAAGTLAAGEMSVSVQDDSATVRRITKISAKKVTASDGNSYGWSFSDDNTDGRVEVEEAGGTDELSVTELEVGGVYVIATPGDTDFTAIGAANSLAATQFTATGPGTGTGTVTQVADTFGI